MPYEFEPDGVRKGRNKYVGSWSETVWRVIPLPYTPDSLRQVIDWGAQPESAPFTHQEIAHWCDHLHLTLLGEDCDPKLESASDVADGVAAQWSLFLANAYTVEQLRGLDFATVRLPTEWFAGWRQQLGRA